MKPAPVKLDKRNTLTSKKKKKKKKKKKHDGDAMSTNCDIISIFSISGQF